MSLAEAPAPTLAPAPRKQTRSRAGRRARSDVPGEGMSREAIIRCAVDLARSESLDQVTMVRVAREMGVAPGLIHYYVGNRRNLLSAVLNEAFRERLAALPPLTGQWRADLENTCRSMLHSLEHWPGVATYIATQNRFRLFQHVGTGEVDYGLRFFDHVGRILQEGGFAAEQAALAYDLAMLFVTSLSVEQVNRQSPGEHKDFIKRYVSRFQSAEVPGAAFLVDPFADIDNGKRLDAGLKLLLDGFESWLGCGS